MIWNRRATLVYLQTYGAPASKSGALRGVGTRRQSFMRRTEHHQNLNGHCVPDSIRSRSRAMGSSRADPATALPEAQGTGHAPAEAGNDGWWWRTGSVVDDPWPGHPDIHPRFDGLQNAGYRAYRLAHDTLPVTTGLAEVAAGIERICRLASGQPDPWTLRTAIQDMREPMRRVQAFMDEAAGIVATTSAEIRLLSTPPLNARSRSRSPPSVRAEHSQRRRSRHLGDMTLFLEDEVTETPTEGVHRR